MRFFGVLSRRSFLGQLLGGVICIVTPPLTDNPRHFKKIYRFTTHDKDKFVNHDNQKKNWEDTNKIIEIINRYEKQKKILSVESKYYEELHCFDYIYVFKTRQDFQDWENEISVYHSDTKVYQSGYTIQNFGYYI